MNSKIKILVTGATGNQGGAVIRELKKYGVEIHALTRNPSSKPAKALQKNDITLIQGNLGNIDSLRNIKETYDFVFFITDFWAGKEREILFGKNIIETMKGRCNHFIFSSTPSSTEEGIFSFSDSKFQIEKILKASQMNYSIIRPGLFMELFKNLKFAPPIILGMMLKKINHEKRLPFVSLEDIGKVVGKIVLNRENFINSDFNVITEYISLGEIKKLHKEIKGRSPFHFALPDFVFKRVVGKELYDLWNWLNTKEGQYDSNQFLNLNKNAINFKLFLNSNRLPI